ncbi:hypothetical protein HNR00_004901 [Methylorubrum rhodinum]|uniref:Uncharacterized protein n=1 Tax=Methylorubrum rhodinum TaxID=29428 RepID=A0A840ZSY8_9HYPH|nr:hypothetical protein [Methylorubrum rhodinum]MBB5760155.1 hypothetical protein [Methylorubrum rhodinum]
MAAQADTALWTMKPHFLLIRSRSGRFNLTLITDHGRLQGVVQVDVETHQSQDDIRKMAMEKVKLLAEAFCSKADLEAAVT